MADTGSKRRSSDRRIPLGSVNYRENWYRDVWLFVLSILVMTSIAYGYNLNKERIHDAVKLSKERDAAIYQSRRESIIRQCVEQNGRNRRTKAEINAQIRKLTGVRKLDATKRKAATFLIIDRLAPVKNCEERATKLIGPRRN